MKFIIRFYYIPFLVGVIISIFLWISSIDSKLRVEGMAKLQIYHNLNNEISTAFWDANLKKMIDQFENQNLRLVKKEVLRSQ